jgi:hypothetical protein
LIILYRKIGTLRASAALASWMFRIVRNECLRASPTPAGTSTSHSIRSPTVRGDPAPRRGVREAGGRACRGRYRGAAGRPAARAYPAGRVRVRRQAGRRQPGAQPCRDEIAPASRENVLAEGVARDLQRDTP